MDYRIEQLRYLLREDPSSRVFFQLGELLRREGEAVQAVEVLRSGLEHHPSYVAAWVSLGRSHHDLGAHEEANAALEIALEIDRENPVAARLLGETAIEREDWLSAVKALKLTRALGGGDEELDDKITMVEEYLAVDGRLELPAEERPRSELPARNLEVVSLSADDPFSASSDDAEGGEANGDVFETAEASTDGVADEVPPDGGMAVALEEEPPVPEGDALDEVTPEEPPRVEDAPEADAVVAEPEVVEDVEESDAEAVDGFEAAADVVSDADAGMDADADTDTDTDTDADTDADADAETDLGGDDAQVIDESSMGAWSANLQAAGVSGEEAWTEPTDEPAMGEGVFFSDDAWAEPTAAPEIVGISAGRPVEVEEEPTPEESFPEEEQPVEDIAEDFETSADDGVLPGEDRGFESVEVTRPISIADLAVGADMASEPIGEEMTAPPAEVVDEGSTDDDVEIADKRHELEHGVPLPTMTLAKLALDQDDRPLAMATLESLIERDPTNTEAVAMLDELRAREETVANEKLRALCATAKIAALQGWLDGVRLAAERRV